MFEQHRRGVFLLFRHVWSGGITGRGRASPLRPCVLLRVSFMEKPLHGLLSSPNQTPLATQRSWHSRWSSHTHTHHESHVQREEAIRALSSPAPLSILFLKKKPYLGGDFESVLHSVGARYPDGGGMNARAVCPFLILLCAFVLGAYCYIVTSLYPPSLIELLGCLFAVTGLKSVILVGLHHKMEESR